MICEHEYAANKEGFFANDYRCAKCGHETSGAGTGLKFVGGTALAVAILVLGMATGGAPGEQPGDG